MIKVKNFGMYIDELYAGKDLELIKNAIPGKKTDDSNNQDDNSGEEEEEEGASWLDDFLSHPIKALIKFLMNGLASIVDAIQIKLNEIQTSGDFTSQDETLLYSYDDLKRDASGEDISNNSTEETRKGVGNRDKYTKVSGYQEKEKGQTDIDDINYTSKTKIPIVVGDFYNIAADKIDFLDMNFLTGNKEKKDKKLVHDKDSTWNKIREPVVEIIKISIYVSSAILIIMLIRFAIGIIYTGMKNPQKQAEYKKGLEDLSKSLFMLIATIIIMALCIFFSKSIFKSISENNGYKLPIRVDVKTANYSFSTNITGYLRYMSQIEDVNYAFKKAGYTVLYLGFVNLNLVAVAFMILRIFILWFLSIQGPLLAANYAIRKKGLRQYNTWLQTYIILSMIQVGYSLIYKIMYEMIDWM